MLEGGDVIRSGHCGKCGHIFGNTYSESQLLAPEDPDPRDAAVVVGAKQNDTGKGILSQFVQALEHACEEHEGVFNQLIEGKKEKHTTSLNT